MVSFKLSQQKAVMAFYFLGSQEPESLLLPTM
jgi:hypothetical protein